MSKLFLEISEQTQVSISGEGVESISTDAPKEHGGSGRFFSPTDLLAASLGSCILTVMSLYAKPMKINLKGTKAVVIKDQGDAKPGHVGILEVHIYSPQNFDEVTKEKLEKGAKNCPIHHSLVDGIKQSLIFHWGEMPQ